MLYRLGSGARAELFQLLVRRGELMTACALVREYGAPLDVHELLARATAIGDAHVLGTVRAFLHARDLGGGADVGRSAQRACVRGGAS